MIAPKAVYVPGTGNPPPNFQSVREPLISRIEKLSRLKNAAPCAVETGPQPAAQPRNAQPSWRRRGGEPPGGWHE
ncbi:hypothetical protein BH23ACT11_BH23ACT11_24450 [soil metagenome]